MNDFFSKLIASTKSFLAEFINAPLQEILFNNIILFFLFFCIFSIVYKIIKKTIIKFIYAKLQKFFPDNSIVKPLIKNKILNSFLLFIYFFILYASLESFAFSSIFTRFFFLIVAVSLFLLVNKLISFLNESYSSISLSKSIPIKGYLQLAKIIISLLIIIVCIGVLLDKSPKILLGGIGALTAVILLIFRDTILSVVASLQIFSNRLISTNDWITVPSLAVDGEVIDINLHQVIIKNWDKSLSILPIYQLVNTSFKNWSNMYKEGRRIAQSFWISQETVHFLKPKEQKILQKKLTGEEFNPDENKKTNLFYFRKYVSNYLTKHPKIDSNNTLLVRNLKSTIDGIQVEVYAFCKETEWAKYEQVQSEIMEYLTATAGDFGLKIFQRKI